jgi:hypothetical protein
MNESMASAEVFAALARLDEAFVIRVDDVGMSDDDRHDLLGRIAGIGHSVNAAVVPIHAVRAADSLTPLLRTHSGRIEIHQHGWSHANHEPSGRKSEFGSARDSSVNAADIARGKALLHEVFGPAFVPVFCPPWNRVNDDLLRICSALRFSGVSAFGQLVVAPPMCDVSVNIDVTKALRLGPSPGAGLVQCVSEVLSSARAPRLMIHPDMLTRGETETLLAFLVEAAASGAVAVPFSALCANAERRRQ